MRHLPLNKPPTTKSMQTASENALARTRHRDCGGLDLLLRRAMSLERQERAGAAMRCTGPDRQTDVTSTDACHIRIRSSCCMRASLPRTASTPARRTSLAASSFLFSSDPGETRH